MRFNTIEVRDTCLVEFAAPDSLERMTVLPRAQIRRVSAQEGSYAERPLLQLVVSSLLLLLGVFLVLGMPGMSSPLGGKALALPLIPLLLGGWALRDSLRRGHYLRVELKNGDARKLRLRPPFEREELTRFLDYLKNSA